MVDKDFIKMKHIYFGESSFRKFGNDEYIKSEDINEMFREYLQKVKIEDLRKKSKIPMRTGMIIILEEEIKFFKKDRSQCDYDDVYKKGGKKFYYSRRDKKDYLELDDVHPENPFIKYEDNNDRMSKYYSSINHIIINSYWLLDYEEVYESLDFLHEDLKRNLNK